MTKKYHAFLSYSRQQDAIAKKLHRWLERFAIPRHFRRGTPGRLKLTNTLQPVFRDRTDLSGGGILAERINDALERSERLIVLCSPAAAQSRWVNLEVLKFLDTTGPDHIFPVISPDAGDTDNIEGELFPPALRGRGLLAADLRQIRRPDGKLIGDGMSTGRLKLISGILNATLDDLLQREKRRQRLTALAMGCAVLLFGGLAAFAGIQTLAERAQREFAQSKSNEANANAAEAARLGGLARANEQRALLGEAQAREQAGIATRNAALAQENEARAERAAAQATGELAARRFDAENWFDAVVASLTWAKQSPGLSHLGFLRWAADGLSGREYLPVADLEAYAVAPDRPAFYFAANGKINVFEISTRKIVQVDDIGGEISELYAGSEQLVAHTSEDAWRSYRVADYKLTAELETGGPAAYSEAEIAISPSGKHIVACQLDKVTVYNGATLKMITEFDLGSGIFQGYTCAFLTSTELYASGSGKIIVANLETLTLETVKVFGAEGEDIRGAWFDRLWTNPQDEEEFQFPQDWPLYPGWDPVRVDGGAHQPCVYASGKQLDREGVWYPMSYTEEMNFGLRDTYTPGSIAKQEFYPLDSSRKFFGWLEMDNGGVWYLRKEKAQYDSCVAPLRRAAGVSFADMVSNPESLARRLGVAASDWSTSTTELATGMVALIGRRVIVANPSTLEIKVDLAAATEPYNVVWTPDFRSVFLMSEQGTEIYDGVLGAFVGSPLPPYDQFRDIDVAQRVIEASDPENAYEENSARRAVWLFADLSSVKKILCARLLANAALYAPADRQRLTAICE